MANPTTKELAQLLISGIRKTINAADGKHATAIRVAGHRLGRVLTVTLKDKKYSVTLSKRKTEAGSRKPTKAKKPGGKTPKLRGGFLD